MVRHSPPLRRRSRLGCCVGQFYLITTYLFQLADAAAKRVNVPCYAQLVHGDVHLHNPTQQRQIVLAKLHDGSVQVELILYE